jgi:hypothetical protein
MAAFALSSSAVGAGALLLAGAFLVPVYSGQAVTSDGTNTTVVSTSGTLIGENGTDVIPFVAMPLVLAVIAWVGLRRECTAGSCAGRRVAKASAWLLGALAVLGAMTIGVFVAPIALLLGLGIAVTPHGPAPTA